MEQTNNPGRERVLARIRSALREAAPKHAAPASSGPVFAPISDPLDRFQKECALNSTECVIAAGAHATAAAVATVLSSITEGEIFVQDAPALRNMLGSWQGEIEQIGSNKRIKWSSAGGPAEESQATITLAEALVAQTGSVFVSASCGGRGASVVAPVHIVVASVDQLVPDLETAFARLRESNAPAKNSMLCLITGSSRTADIEKIIVMGAHGPRRLVVVLSLGEP
jgi:L-lactate dehydrogenase complex protein LldG